MNKECLFLHKNTCVDSDDFLTALHSSGVKQGDTIFVHAGLGTFGTLPEEYTREDLCRELVNVLQASVGPSGTVAMPTFTYTFCKGTPFDRQKSPSEVGPLSEFFRTHTDAVRSSHPIFSITALGPRATELTTVGMDAFGTDSAFANLRAANALLVFFGARFEISCTLVHHIEQMHGVPYRSIKIFRGLFRDEDTEKEIACTHFVRPANGKAVTDISRLKAHLYELGLFVRADVGGGTILTARARDVFDVGMHMLDADDSAFLKEKWS